MSPPTPNADGKFGRNLIFHKCHETGLFKSFWALSAAAARAYEWKCANEHVTIVQIKKCSWIRQVRIQIADSTTLTLTNMGWQHLEAWLNVKSLWLRSPTKAGLVCDSSLIEHAPRGHPITINQHTTKINTTTIYSMNVYILRTCMYVCVCSE